MNKNKELFEQSEVFIPGGVNSPVRAFGFPGMCDRSTQATCRSRRSCNGSYGIEQFEGLEIACVALN